MPRTLCQNEVQFEIAATPDQAVPGERVAAGPVDGWWTVTVRATWRSPSKRLYQGLSAVGPCALTVERTAEVIAQEADLHDAALTNLNEELRELLVEAKAVSEYLERDIFEVRAGSSFEGAFPNREGADAYAEQLRKDFGAQNVQVVPTSPAGKIRSLGERKAE